MPPKCAYQVWQWTMSASMPWPLKARQVSSARSGETSGAGQPENRLASTLVPRTVSSPSVSAWSWKLRTSTVASLASSFDRYST